MTFLTTVLSGLGTFFLYLWALFLHWLWIFAVSFVSPNSIWIIIPIWASWFFAEFFQEKRGTSFGNAISNGVVPFWVGIDWLRQLTNQVTAAHLEFSGLLLIKYLISVIAIVFGLIIVIEGIKGTSFIRFVGRIRVVTYFLVMFTPIVYGIIDPNFMYIFSTLLFFPLFYFLIEFICQKIPEPKAMLLDGQNKKKSFDDMKYYK